MVVVVVVVVVVVNNSDLSETLPLAGITQWYSARLRYG
jgi:hypothetical protein